MDISTNEANWFEHLMYYLLFDFAIIAVVVVGYLSIRNIAMSKGKHSKNQYKHY
ncbi:hypothetical protein RHSA111115_03485 [Rheinheimera salexigens]